MGGIGIEGIGTGGGEPPALRYIVSAEEMRRADRATSEVFGVLPQVLMERAALAVAQVLRERWKSSPLGDRRPPRVLVAAGGGGNGGDGIAVARLLHLSGVSVQLAVMGDGARFGAAAREQLAIAERYAVPIARVSAAEDLESLAERPFDMVVDALFGIGVSRPLEGLWRAAVETIGKIKERDPVGVTVVSVDLPSGIHTDTGEVCGAAVRADVTVAMSHWKRGIALYPGALYAGEIVTADVGITVESFQEERPAVAALTGGIRALLPPRDVQGNKGTFGKLLLVAGCGEIGGAAILAARGAFAAGVGMVRVFTEERNRDAILARVPEALIDVWREAQPPEERRQALRRAISWADACAIGPGLGQGEAAAQILQVVLEDGTLPLVIDADGCNLIARDASLRTLLRHYRGGAGWPVLTPHVGEFARLSGRAAGTVKRELLTAPRALAQELGCTVLCKDARSVAVGPDCAIQFLNLSGHDGMATAGSGDVLTGIVGALAAQGVPPLEAAARGSRIHGLAGEQAGEALGRHAMTASDIIDGLRLAAP